MRSSNLWQGVVGYWSVSAGPSGYRLLDRSGRGNHGTLANMTADDWVGDGRYALDFDGSNDYITAGNQAAYFQSTEPFYFACWVKINLFVSNGGIFARANGNVQGYHMRTLSTSRIRWIVYNANGANFYGVDTSVLSTGVWYSIVGSFFNGVSRLWLNGIEQTTTLISGTVGSIAQDFPFEIGRFNDVYGSFRLAELVAAGAIASPVLASQFHQIGRGGMLTPRRRRRAYSVATGLRRRLLLTGQV
jgi:hypothetical protein